MHRLPPLVEPSCAACTAGNGSMCASGPERRGRLRRPCTGRTGSQWLAARCRRRVARELGCPRRTRHTGRRRPNRPRTFPGLRRRRPDRRGRPRFGRSCSGQARGTGSRPSSIISSDACRNGNRHGVVALLVGWKLRSNRAVPSPSVPSVMPFNQVSPGLHRPCRCSESPCRPHLAAQTPKDSPS